MSWIDLLVRWGTTRRVPWWVLMAATFVGLGLMFNVVKWIDGSIPFGTVGRLTTNAFYVPFAVTSYGVLSHAADAAILRFRPALDVSDAEFERTRVRFVTTRPWVANASALAGVAFAALSILPDPTARSDFGSSLLTGLVLGSAGLAAGYGLALVLIIRIFRIVRDVEAFHRKAVGIELFDIGPAHAFAPLTAGAGVVLLVAFSYSAATDRTTFTNPALIALNVFLTILAVTAFIGPLLGMRKRLRHAKATMLVAAIARLRVAVAALESAVDAGRFAEITPITAAVTALDAEVTRIKQASTYPWDPRTVRGFATTLLLPVVTWLLTVGVGRIFDLSAVKP